MGEEGEKEGLFHPPSLTSERGTVRGGGEKEEGEEEGAPLTFYASFLSSVA